jgi:hypothetical protein
MVSLLKLQSHGIIEDDIIISLSDFLENNKINMKFRDPVEF